MLRTGWEFQSRPRNHASCAQGQNCGPASRNIRDGSVRLLCWLNAKTEKSARILGFALYYGFLPEIFRIKLRYKRAEPVSVFGRIRSQRPVVYCDFKTLLVKT